MDPSGPFRAVSLDLWFTTVFHDAGDDVQWEGDRIRLLAELLREPGGGRYSVAAIESATQEVRLRRSAEGGSSVTQDPAAAVAAYVAALGARLVLPMETAAEAFSSAGMDLHPPQLNPETTPLLRTLNDRGIPVIAVTNTARRASTWIEFLNRRHALGFRDVITSCELGRAKPDPALFREAARRLGVPPGEIVHVGDRWELDVEGALRAGCVPLLYRGLWARYPKGLYGETEPDRPRDPDVRCIDRLEEVLGLDLRPPS